MKHNPRDEPMTPTQPALAEPFPRASDSDGLENDSTTMVTSRRLSLVFHRQAEQAFRQETRTRSLPLVRPTLLLLALLFAWWTVQLMQAMAPVEQVALSAATGLVFVATWALAYRREAVWHEVLTLVAAGLAGLSLTLLEALAASRSVAPPHAALILLVMVVYTALGLRLHFAAALGWTLIPLWAGGLALAGTALAGLLPVLWLLTVANLAGMVAALHTEHHARRSHALEQLLRQEQGRAHSAQEALARKNRVLREMATMDALTGLYNRRRFDEKISREWHRLLRTGEPLSLIFCDVDRFKLYNDSRGHLMGDRCLRAIAHELGGHARRAADMAARFGGEEFVLLLPQTTENDAALLAERLRAAVEALGLWHAHPQVDGPVTISLGVATLVPSKELQPQSLVALADKALYRAKEAGRNRVAIHGTAQVTPPPRSRRSADHISEPI